MSGRGRITRDSLERLNQAVPLSSLIEESVTLRSSNGKSVGLCPFHQESTASFNVFDDHYHCFGCGAHGKAIDFEMHRTGATFPEAAQSLAERFNITLNFEGGRSDGKAEEAYRKRQSLIAVMEEVVAFYERCLNHSSGTASKTYLNGERSLSDETIALFSLGCAPNRNALEILASKKSWATQSLVDVGLIKKSEKSPGRFYDVLRSRIIIPIHDEKGAPIGFGARVMPQEPGTEQHASGPKYLNSPETELFSKSQTVFNLHRARKSMLQQREVLVVEGYMDVIGLVQAGITNVVAVLGTALTPDHIRLLSRYVDHVILCFDSDKAGQKALTRSFEVAWPMNLVRLSAFSLGAEAKDPDEFIGKFGKEHFIQAMHQAKPLLQWVIQATTAGLAYREDRVRAVRKALIPIVERLPGQAERTAALRDIAEIIGLPGPAGLTAKSRPTAPARGSTQDRNPQAAQGAPQDAQGATQGAQGASQGAQGASQGTQGASQSAQRPEHVGPPSSEAAPIFDLSVTSATELRFLVLITYSRKEDLPRTLVNLYSGQVGINVTEDLITLRTLQSVLSPQALQTLDELMQVAMESEEDLPHLSAVRPKGEWARISAGSVPNNIARALRAFQQKDLSALESLGINLKLLQVPGASSNRFSPEASIFDARNLSFLKFLFRNAEIAQNQQTIASQIAKILLDLEIAYLDQELATWASVETVRGAGSAAEPTPDAGRYRRVMEERAKRLLAK